MSIFDETFGPGGFDTTQVEDSDFELLPPGEYPVMIESAVIKDTKKCTGKKLEICAAIVDGPGKGRKLWDNYCIQHQNPKTESIARSKLAKLCKNCGISLMRSEQELVGKTVVANVVVDDKYNKIKEYSSYDPTNQQAASLCAKRHKPNAWHNDVYDLEEPVTQQQPDTSAVPPWKR